MFEKEIELHRESRQFQLQMMQMMTSLINSHSSPSFPPPIATSTQYPHLHRQMYSPYDEMTLHKSKLFMYYAGVCVCMP